jgi:hypothetical protein
MISPPPIPSWTVKECVYITFAFIASGLAAYGTFRLGRAIGHGQDAETITEILTLVVFFWTLSLMIKGVDAIQSAGRKKEIEQRARGAQLSG